MQGYCVQALRRGENTMEKKKIEISDRWQSKIVIYEHNDNGILLIYFHLQEKEVNIKWNIFCFAYVMYSHLVGTIPLMTVHKIRRQK